VPEFDETVITGTLGVTAVVLIDCAAYISPPKAWGVDTISGRSESKPTPCDDFRRLSRAE
jgi:hypothetical protein